MLGLYVSGWSKVRFPDWKTGSKNFNVAIPFYIHILWPELES